MKLDISNVFVKIYITLDGENLIMNIRGQLFDILIGIFPEVYDKYVQYKGKKNSICTDAQSTVRNARFFNSVLKGVSKRHRGDWIRN